MKMFMRRLKAAQALQADPVSPAVRHARLGEGEFDGEAPARMTNLAHALRNRRLLRSRPRQS